MFYSDKKLLLLYGFLEKHPFDRQRIAEHLEVSDRHLTRLLNLWHEEGMIEYKKGQGRGIHSEVVFKVNPEERFVNQFMRNLNKLTLSDIEETLNLPISEVSKKVIKEKTEILLYQRPVKEKTKEKKNVFIDYMDAIPDRATEGNHRYLQSEHLLYNTMCRLYDLNDEGAVKNGLVAFDEWHGDRLRIYIRKDIQFYNGDILYASDIAESLTRYLNTYSNDLLDEIIQSIEVVSAFQLEIATAYRTDLLKPMLASLEAGIHKIEGDHVLTTGPFYIENYEQRCVTLLRNPYYMNPAGDLEKIKLVNDINQYVPYLNQKNMETRSIPLRNRIEYVLLNPHSDSLDYHQRLYVLSVIQKFKDAYIKGPGKIEQRVFQEYQERLPPGQDPMQFAKPLKLLCIDRMSFGTDPLVQFLIENDVPVLTTYISSDDYHNMDLNALEIDMLLASEFIPSSYRYLYLFKNAKFSGWFRENQLAKDMVHVYKNKSKEYWTYMENQFNSHLIGGAYVMPITYASKRINVPESFKNIWSSAFGVIDYNQIIVVESGEAKQEDLHNGGGVS